MTATYLKNPALGGRPSGAMNVARPMDGATAGDRSAILEGARASEPACR